MKVSVIGISHHGASVAIRESFALPGETAGRLLRAIQAEEVIAEAMVLDTCNRTEVYFVWSREHDFAAYLLGHAARIKGAEALPQTDALYRHDGQAAITHLFRVAAGLDSQVVGEDQILGQIRSAYRQAAEARTARFLLNKLLHAALRVGKRVRSETQLGKGAGSVAAAAVALAKQIFSRLAGKRVLLVGAGETAELAARTLLLNGADRITVANRTLYRAQHMAAELAAGPSGDSPDRPGGAPTPPPVQTRAIDLAGVPAAAAEADLVICSTGSPEPVLTGEHLAGRRRGADQMCIIDLAVPRDVDPAVGNLPNVYLYNLDDLSRLVDQDLRRRRQEVPRVEAIIGEEIRQFDRWLASRQVAPTITLLRKRLDTLRAAEIDRYGGKFADTEQLDRFTRSLVSKILHDPMTFLHAIAHDRETPDSMVAVDVLRRMFGLDAYENSID